MALLYCSPPEAVAGITQASANPIPRAKPMEKWAMADLVRTLAQFRAHQGLRQSTGNVWIRITGPFDRIPNPRPAAIIRVPKRRFALRMYSPPRTAKRVKKDRTRSNITTVQNAAHTIKPMRTRADSEPIPFLSGHNSWAIFAVSHVPPRPNKEGTSLGHQLFTPNRAQPRCMSQNSRGGLWE